MFLSGHGHDTAGNRGYLARVSRGAVPGYCRLRCRWDRRYRRFPPGPSGPDPAGPGASFLGLQLLTASLTDRHLGLAASLSALANQPWLPKPDFTAFLQAALDHPAVVGVNVAHSGTVAGVFFGCEASPASREAVIDTLCRQFPQWSYRETVQLQPGGILQKSGDFMIQRFEHGGNVYQPSPKGKAWLDFSANINPLGLSPAVRQALAAHLDQVSTIRIRPGLPCARPWNRLMAYQADLSSSAMALPSFLSLYAYLPASAGPAAGSFLQ